MKTPAANFYDASKETGSDFAGRMIRQSWENSPFVDVHSDGSHFRCDRSFVINGEIPFITPAQKGFLMDNPGMYLPRGYSFTSASDGIGTKVVLADSMEHYRTMAMDLIAMAADDIARWGGVPLVYSNVVDYNNLDGERQMRAYTELFEGLASVAAEQDIVLITGESAGLRACVGSPNPNAVFPFNWSGTMQGLKHEKLNITGSAIRPGDIVVALRQDGFRSNGISRVRKAFETKYGQDYYRDAPRDEIAEALTPSVVYARAVAEINGWYSGGERVAEMTSVSHLSGGSFVSKFLEPALAPRGLSARLDRLYAMPEITRRCAMWLAEGGEPMTLGDIYHTWCSGQGMLLTVRSMEDAERVVAALAGRGIEAQVAGEIFETSPGQHSSVEIDTINLEGAPATVRLAA